MGRAKKIIALTMVAASMISGMAFAAPACEEGGTHSWRTEYEKFPTCRCKEVVKSCSKCGITYSRSVVRCHNHRY